MNDAPNRRLSQRWLGWATLAVLLLGALEGWFGKTDSGDVYGSDAVQYLDCARAIGRGDWHSALNPLWSQGYPALLALARPLFRQGAWGDWLSTRTVNFLIFAFSWAAFVFLLLEIARLRRWSAPRFASACAVFVAAQILLDQVSRVGPDQLVAAIFFLVCALLLRLRRIPTLALTALLGLVLGLGFVAKAVFLLLGCCVLAITALILRRLPLVLPAAAIFAFLVLGYGSALSRAVGHPTLGEAGSLNYAWHVDRLQKWVHWEGGVEPAAEAWPKPSIARFVRWDASPPDFGTPLHPSQRLGTAPVVYVFHEPALATYVPYYDPAYWYTGYKHVFRWRYQLVAVGKNAGDLLVVLLKQPLAWALALILLLGWRGLRPWIRVCWPVVVLAVLGLAIYLPVHLEGRYLSAFLAVLGLVIVAGVEKRSWLIFVGLAFALGLVHDQHTVWARAVHGWSPRSNVEWKISAAIVPLLAPNSDVGVLAWTPNLHCDWAYMSRMRITSEIASGADEAAFWHLSPAGQAEVLARFRTAGARAVLTWDRPPAGAEGWESLAQGAMWMHRL